MCFVFLESVIFSYAFMFIKFKSQRLINIIVDMKNGLIKIIILHIAIHLSACRTVKIKFRLRFVSRFSSNGLRYQKRFPVSNSHPKLIPALTLNTA